MKSYVAALVTSITVFAFASFAFADTTPAIIKNIKTDFGAHCNGVDNDVQAFTDFHDWALKWQETNSGLIELDIPSGSVCEFITPRNGRRRHTLFFAAVCTLVLPTRNMP